MRSPSASHSTGRCMGSASCMALAILTCQRLPRVLAASPWYIIPHMFSLPALHITMEAWFL